MFVKRPYGAFRLVFGDVKVLSLETVDGLPVIVGDDDIDDDQLCACLQSVGARRGGLRESLDSQDEAEECYDDLVLAKTHRFLPDATPRRFLRLDAQVETRAWFRVRGRRRLYAG
jgi:hypothetical protein